MRDAFDHGLAVYALGVCGVAGRGHGGARMCKCTIAHAHDAGALCQMPDAVLYQFDDSDRDER